eukprot:TRINITY_DN9732_c0_g1_i1.p1 TRINITY_DN9732_c0_g1~~TRINITY_DN9732_c0_g1_i1.p1  ORF type:complete len:390 (-),score=101.55 TRINITY_DN9732_c0_g1_i1:188-1357(-)
MLRSGQGAGQDEEVFEYTPEPTPTKASSALAGATSRSQAARDGLDERPGPNPRDVQGAFAKREGAVPRRDNYESLGSAANAGFFEPPEQKLAKLQVEVTELLKLASAPSKDPVASAELLGGQPADVAEELRVLDQRLTALARDGPAIWKKSDARVADGTPGPMAMPGALISQLEQFAAGVGGTPNPGVEQDGRVTYEIAYAPSASAVADSSKIAALETTVAEIEKQLGMHEHGCPFGDLHTAVAQLQKRVSLLDTGKLDVICQRVKAVMGDVDKMLEKKAELENRSRNDELDQKVNELYEFCHRWNAASAALPHVVARLRSLQVLHQQSASFVTRLQALEEQQEELMRMLETTNSAVHELGVGLQDNMATIRDNMRSLEEKVSKVLTSK